VVSSAGRATDS